MILNTHSDSSHRLVGIPSIDVQKDSDNCDPEAINNFHEAFLALPETFPDLAICSVPLRDLKETMLKASFRDVGRELEQPGRSSGGQPTSALTPCLRTSQLYK